MGDLREPNGEESGVTSSSTSSAAGGAGAGVGLEVWARAEEATQGIIRQVQPTVVSEERRRDVVDYIQRLLKGYLNSEVFPFGSVPLKTYLPDGDIDLTAFCGFNIEEAFANDVCSVLQAEDQNPAAEFVVKDVQLIHAEVKLVKCLVQNIVVDISFNQIGGLCALCFLEEVDRLIGKDHLFKRSIILIKAWCYYESRILGAHHGLISTYALETLVLYIFHLFHSSLNGPLAVLHKFLDYFSKFDWEHFCVSLSGPVRVASLPEISAERPETSGGDLLLSDDFMMECVKKFSVPSRGAETNYRTFMQKHLNIVDPLKENNNLGRSVSKGNFFRIRSAFSYGARKLGQILVQPQENIGEEVRKFFTNTLDRHGKGQRPDVQDQMLLPGCNGVSSELVFPVFEPYQGRIHVREGESVCFNSQSNDGRVDFEVTEHVVVSNSRKSGACLDGTVIGHQKDLKKSGTRSLPVSKLSEEELSACASHHSGDANDLAKPVHQDFRIAAQGDRHCPSMAEVRKSVVGDLPRAHLPLENGQMENGDLDEEQHTHSSSSHIKLDARLIHLKVNGVMSCRQGNSHLCDTNDDVTSTDSLRHSSENVDAHGLQDSHAIYHSSVGTAGRHEIVNVLPDLSGDVDCHLHSVHYGRWWYDCGLAMPIHPVHLPPPPMFQTKGPWDGFRQPVQFRQEVIPQMNVNGVVPRPAYFPANPPVAHFVDDIPKARGIGTYFPITNHNSYRDRPSPKARYPGQLKSPRINGRGSSPMDKNPQNQNPFRQGPGRPKASDSPESSPKGKVYKEANGFLQLSEKPVEYGSHGLAPPPPPPPPPPPCPEASLPEREECRPLDSDPSSGSQNGESVLLVDDVRFSVQSYRLKDDEDFPPLSA